MVENALYRLKELSPDEERRVLLEDITRLKPRFAGTAVRELPAQDVPRVDDAVGPKLKVVDRKLSPSVYLEQFTAVFSAIPLASKFGTKRLLKKMRELYRDSNWDCMMTNWFVAYFVRVDAEEGAQVFAEAMAERKENLCYQFLISQVSGIVWNGVVQKQVMATLNEAEGEAASSAASALATHGGKDVEPALWQRLEKWSERWNGRATGFRGNPITGVGQYEGDPSLGSALFQAIANARAWVLDEARARKLILLCIDDACREEWGHYKFSPVRLSDSLGLYGNQHIFQVGPYGSASPAEAEAKISQYPTGTVFEFCPLKDSGDQMQEMEKFAKAQGMVCAELHEGCSSMMFVVMALFAGSVAAGTNGSCEGLLSATLVNGTIANAQSVPASEALPAFCKVAATLKPTSDSNIKMEVWLPAAGWNGKFEAVGNGGWSGSINANALAAGLGRGYATAMSDLGHEGDRATFALGHPEKLIDFGYRAAHEMTAAAKVIIANYYGRAPRLSYWNGCSAGGRSALMEAQRFPADFDGIVAGAPGLNWTGRALQSVWIAQAEHKSDASYLPPAKYSIIHEAVLGACDAQDGVKDGVLEDPTRCKFDPKELECRARMARRA